MEEKNIQPDTWHGSLGCTVVLALALFVLLAMFITPRYFAHQENLAQIQHCGQVE